MQIEVEKKFQPTPEQLEKLLDGAEFLGEKKNTDVYYDYPDYSLFKKDVRFRNRNGNYELKIGQGDGVAEEIENEEGIKKYFNTAAPLKEFIEKNLIPFMEYGAKRMKYKKGDFTIDVDEMSFGYNLTEIELLVDSEDKIAEAGEKISELVKSCGIEIKELLSKRKMYIKTVKPELYETLFG
jgi:predicted adenylyl cyclase CyaB